MRRTEEGENREKKGKYRGRKKRRDKVGIVEIREREKKNKRYRKK